MKYAVSYTEMRKATVVVEADSKEEAESKVLEAIENDDIVPIAGDYSIIIVPEK